jgi:ABC-2 type transport system permease protein
MNAVLAIARRETAAYFSTPIGWICLCAFATLTGFFFFVMLTMYSDYAAQAMMSPGQADSLNVDDLIVSPLFDNMAVIALLMSPALTMRLFAEDRKTRAMDLLLTSPVTSFQVVLGKFLGAMGFAGVLVASTLHFPAILTWLGEPDRGILVANYVSFLLLLGAFFAVGMLASALTENQLVALVVAFGVNLLLWVLGWSVSSSDAGLLKTVVESLSMVTHAERLGKGLVHVQDIVYFLSFIGFCLFATTQRVEALRWR